MIYDTVIIGAGPAGSTFARLIAGSGRRILLIDGQTEKNKKPCGGLLAPDAQKALAHFDLVLPKSVLVDPQIFSVKTIDVCHQKVRYYARHYLNIDRYAFDQWLISLVPETVEICNGKCLRAEKNGELFELTIRLDAEIKTIQARMLVGADGAASIVRKSFFHNDIMRYVAIQQWFPQNGEINSFYSCIFDKNTSESCSWSICKDGSFIFGGCFKPQQCRSAFETQKKRLLAYSDFNFDNCTKTEACLAMRPRKISDFKTGKNGVFLIGEAAGFISPSSFEGISNAIISGKLLADSFLKLTDAKDIGKQYQSKTRPLKWKLSLKIIKRWFMYTPFTRYLIMKSGINSIDIWQDKK